MTRITSTQPEILLVSLRHRPYWDHMYSALIYQLSQMATVERATDGNAVISTILGSPPRAVLLTDAALTRHKHASVWDAVLDYVRAGGIAVCMGQFSSFVRPRKIRPFFERAGLTWERGSHHRTTVVLDKHNVPRDAWPFLAESYSQQAIFLKNVDNSEAWYRQTRDSMVESPVYPPTPVEDVSYVPVALASVGQGKLGYIGDVNTEQASYAAIFVMCGLHR